MHDRFIGESKEINVVKKAIALVGNSNVPVLILGKQAQEKNWWREQYMPFLHGLPILLSSSMRVTCRRVFLKVSFSDIRKVHLPGRRLIKSVSSQIANTGTFFVDEVADMGTPIQSKLLEVLETGAFRKLGDTKEVTVDVRFILPPTRVLKRK